MATDISDAFINQYESEVKQAFQRRGSYLLSTIRTKGKVKGSAVIFQAMGTGVATTKSRHGTITPMNVSHTPTTITLVDFYAGDWADFLDLYKISIDERMELAAAGAMALGRKIDEQITAAMDATTQTAITVTVTSFANVRKGILDTVKILMDNDVPMNDGQLWGVMTNQLWMQLMQVDQFQRTDYVGPADLPYMSAVPAAKQFRTWIGINWQPHNGLPGRGTSSAKGWVYHRTALGYGYSVIVEGAMAGDSRADITWHGDRQAWFIVHSMSGQASQLDDRGCIEMTWNDTTGLATS